MMRRKGRRLRRTPMQRAHEKKSGQHSEIKLRGEAGRQKNKSNSDVAYPYRKSNAFTM